MRTTKEASPSPSWRQIRIPLIRRKSSRYHRLSTLLAAETSAAGLWTVGLALGHRCSRPGCAGPTDRIAEALVTSESGSCDPSEARYGRSCADRGPWRGRLRPAILPAGAPSFPKVLRRRLDRFFADGNISPKANRMMWTKIAVGWLCWQAAGLRFTRYGRIRGSLSRCTFWAGWRRRSFC
jgi:hypothetical protein